MIVSSARGSREPRECLYRMANVAAQERNVAVSPTTGTFSSRPLKCEQYTVFGPRARRRESQSIQSVRYCERRRAGGLNAFGEVAMVRITRHPFCKLSTHPALSPLPPLSSLSLVLSAYLSFCPSLRLSFPLCSYVFLSLSSLSLESIIALKRNGRSPWL